MVEFLRLRQERTPATQVFLDAKANFIAAVERLPTPPSSAFAQDAPKERKLLKDALKIAGKPVSLAERYGREEVMGLFPLAKTLVYLDSFEQSRDRAGFEKGQTKRVLIIADADTISYGAALHDSAACIEGRNRVSLVSISASKPEVKGLLEKLNPDIVYFLPPEKGNAEAIDQLLHFFVLRKDHAYIRIYSEDPSCVEYRRWIPKLGKEEN